MISEHFANGLFTFEIGADRPEHGPTIADCLLRLPCFVMPEFPNVGYIQAQCRQYIESCCSRGFVVTRRSTQPGHLPDNGKASASDGKATGVFSGSD